MDFVRDISYNIKTREIFQIFTKIEEVMEWKAASKF